MTHIEDILRDAYRGAAETIEPESVRDLDVRPAPLLRRVRHQQSRRNRVMIPMAAAASVAMVVVLAAVIVPRAMNGTDTNGQSPGTGTSGRYPRYFVSITTGPGQLSVNRASTGAFVTEIRMPGRGMLVHSVAGWGNQDFVAAILRPGVCATWLYTFRLNDQGHPSPLAPLAVLRGRQLENISLSGNGEKLAFYAIECGGSHGSASRNDLGVMDMTTQRTRQWAIPVQASASLSLSASGHLLAYSFGSTLNSAPSVMVMPTNAAPGPAVTRSRTVVRAAQFGRSTKIGSAVLTPDGRTVYVVTSSTGTVRAWNPVWQLRAVDLAGRQSRLVASFAGFPSAIAADPAVRNVLVMFEPASSGPSPSPSPSGKPTPSPSPSPTGKPTPSASPSPTGKPTPSPVPTGQPTPSPSPSSGNQPRQLLVRIDLSTGQVTYLRAVPVAVLSYFW